MKLHVGDKVLLKKTRDLSEAVEKSMGADGLEFYDDNFAEKEFTVSEVLSKDPLIVEFEEDEDERDLDNLLKNAFFAAAVGFDNPATKKHHFSEEFIEKVIENKSKGRTFGWALRHLKKGKKVAREGWNGKGLWLELQRPDANSKMTLPYIYMNYPKGDKYHDGCRVPWLASQTDMLEEDWFEVE